MLTPGTVRNVCVIGAGTMGSGIAAHLANLGFNVSLLDLTMESVTAAFEKARQARPPHFYNPDRAHDVRLGSISEHLHWISDADWVCEAIVERMPEKQSLYAQIDPLLRPDAMVSTNTSGLQISLLAEGRSESFRRKFVGTHFFNPPRYLKLLELIPTPETDPAVVDFMKELLESHVARRVVLAKDTPGFIANRYGMWCMYKAVHTAEKLHLSVEEVDVITGAFLGRPKSGSFRLNDIVGLDVMRDIASNLLARCPDDPYIQVLQQPVSVHSLLARGWIGEKVGQGFYRKESRELLALDLQTFAYRQKREVLIPSIEQLRSLPLGERIKAALEQRDEVGEFLREYLLPALEYADYLKEDISHGIQDFDRVMEWGFGWEMGPFRMKQALGLADKDLYIPGAQLAYSGSYVPVKDEPEYRTLADYPVVREANTFRVRDLGDGVLAVGLTTKMGVITPQFVNEMTALLEEGNLTRFVLTSEARNFSVGFDLNFFLEAIERQAWQEIDAALIQLQRLGELLEPTQCVAAIYGYTLGAGLELALSCAHIAAAAESTVGLPEARVGLIPGGRGTVLMRVHNQATAKRLTEVAMNITRGITGTSADHARYLGYLRPTDLTVYHTDRLLTDAKLLALGAQPHSRPAWSSEPMPLLGMIDRELQGAQERGELSEFDVTIGNKLKNVFVKSSGYEDAVLRERVEFLDLCGKSFTHARIKHMLDQGKPLRN
jgi:3-hydroxyacyl-CoA dehydrogenase